MRYKGRTWRFFSQYEKRWMNIKQTTKTAAKNAYERGECFYIMPCLLSPDETYAVEEQMFEVKDINSDNDFDICVAQFTHDHCKNPNFGRYPIFFIEEKRTDN